MPLHIQIVNFLRASLQKANNPLGTMIEDKDDDEVCHLLFDNFRGTVDNGKGMHLSQVGLQLMKASFQATDIKMPGGYLPQQKHLIYLDRVVRLPYHLTKDFCCVFDTEFAAMLALSDGSIQTLIESRFRLLGDNGLEQEF